MKPPVLDGPQPDFALPLIDRRSFAEFIGINRQPGRIYPQRRNLSDNRHHPDLFYVEFPYGSGTYFEISARRLGKLLEVLIPADFEMSSPTVTWLLRKADSSIDTAEILRNARPQ